jgi:hypothetical protein
LRGGGEGEEKKREGKESRLHGWVSLAGWASGDRDRR